MDFTIFLTFNVHFIANMASPYHLSLLSDYAHRDLKDISSPICFRYNSNLNKSN